MSNLRVLVIGGEETFVHKTVLCLADAGIETAVATPLRATSLRLSHHVSRAHVLPWALLDKPNPQLAVTIDDLARRSGADLVFPADVGATRALLAVKHSLGCRVVLLPAPDVLETCDDKGRFGDFLDEIGCAQPATTTVVRSLADVDRLDLRWPIIAKPPSGGGGIGVVRLDSPADLARHVASGTADSTLPLLVQEFIPGTDIDFSFYAEDGVLHAGAVQTRDSLSDPTMTFLRHPGVVELCTRMVRGLHYTGLGHADLRIDERDGSVKIIELNPRVWGSVHYAMWMGLNFPALAVHRALGLSFPTPDSIEGVCVNPQIRPLGLLRFGTRRTMAPAGMGEASRHAYATNHGDPWPFVAMKVRRAARAARSRVEALWRALA